MTTVTQPTRGAVTGLPRLLPAAGGPAAQQRGGPAYRDRPGLLIADIEAAGLTGRGGAAFPVHRKLQAVLDAAARRRRVPVVIANGAESEPASDKDATLLWLSPDLVLNGLQLAAEAVGADRAILVVHAGRGHAVGARLRETIAARQAAGTDRVPVQLAQAPARFLAGQETALVSQLAGGPGIPLFVPPRITERGLGGAPTLVQNVESLAHLALIARNGPGWFRSAGTRAEPGSMLATVRRADGQPRVTEIPLGFPLRELAAGLRPEEAVLVGGYHGTWLSGAQALALTMDNRSLAGAGARLGAGIVAVLPAGRCGLVEAARVLRYLALESAGQCGPCLNGLPRMAAALAEIAGARGGLSARAGLAEDLARWSGLVTGRGACHHPDGSARFAGSALRTFAAELGLHQRGRCSATDTRPFLPVPAAAAVGPSQDGS